MRMRRMSRRVEREGGREREILFIFRCIGGEVVVVGRRRRRLRRSGISERRGIWKVMKVMIGFFLLLLRFGRVCRESCWFRGMGMFFL